MIMRIMIISEKLVENSIAKPESQKTTSRGAFINITEQGSMIKQQKHSQ